MAPNDDKKKILVTSFVLTLLIFVIAILLNYGLDHFRINSIMEVMQEHEIDTESYFVEQSFVNMFGGDECGMMSARINLLKEEIPDVGNELSSYGTLSFFNKKDFDYLKRKYILLQMKVYALVSDANDRCNTSFSPILFFYKIDDDRSERQGYILSEISKEYPQQVVVLSFDIDYEDEPLLKLLLQKHMISEAPSIILNSSIVLEGLSYAGEIKPFLDAANG